MPSTLVVTHWLILKTNFIIYAFLSFEGYLVVGVPSPYFANEENKMDNLRDLTQNSEYK